MRNVKTKVNVYVYLTLLMIILTSGHAQQITWTATIKPGSCVICSDEVVDFTMEDEIFELDELPIGEYIERSETEYRWFVDGILVSNSDTLQVLTGNGTNLSPGAHTITLEGSTTYCRVWHENGQKQQTNNVTVNWRSLASTSVQVSTAKAGEWGAWQISDFNVSPEYIEQINSTINTALTFCNIPIISSFNINNFSISKKVRYRDCCYEGMTKTNGEYEKQTNYLYSHTGSVDILGIITGLPTSCMVSGSVFGYGGTISYEIDYNASATISNSIDITEHNNSCTNTNCTSSTYLQENRYSITPIISIIGCYNMPVIGECYSNYQYSNQNFST